MFTIYQKISIPLPRIRTTKTNKNMAGYISDDTRKVTTHRLVEMKQRGEKISMLTSYDYTMAQIVDGAGIDIILVGFLKQHIHLIRSHIHIVTFFKRNAA